jgi:hypothetical protein
VEDYQNEASNVEQHSPVYSNQELLTLSGDTLQDYQAENATALTKRRKRTRTIHWCDYCGKTGHQSTRCYSNPASAHYRGEETINNESASVQPKASEQPEFTEYVNVLTVTSANKSGDEDSGSESSKPAGSQAAAVDGDVEILPPDQEEEMKHMVTVDVRDIMKDYKTIFVDPLDAGFTMNYVEQQIYLKGQAVEKRLVRDFRLLNRKVNTLTEPQPTKTTSQKVRGLEEEYTKMKNELTAVQTELFGRAQTRIAGDAGLPGDHAQGINQEARDNEQRLAGDEAIPPPVEGMGINQGALTGNDYSRLEQLEIENAVNRRVNKYLLTKVQELYLFLGLQVPTGASLPASSEDDEDLDRARRQSNAGYSNRDGEEQYLNPDDYDAGDGNQHGDLTDLPQVIEQGGANTQLPQTNGEEQQRDNDAENTVVILDDEQNAANADGLQQEGDGADNTAAVETTGAHIRVSKKGVVSFGGPTGLKNPPQPANPGGASIVPPQEYPQQQQQPQQPQQRERPTLPRRYEPQEMMKGSSAWKKTFAGTMNEDIVLFLEEFELHNKINNIDLKDYAPLLRLRLEGLARLTIASMTITDKEDYVKVRDYLIKSFHRQDQYLAARSAIQRLAYGGSFGEFIAQLAPLIPKAYPTASQDARDMKMYDVLMEKLPRDLVIEIKRIGCDSLQDVLQKAPRAEAFVKDVAAMTSKVQPVTATFLHTDQTNAGLVGTARDAPDRPWHPDIEYPTSARPKANRRAYRPEQPLQRRNTGYGVPSDYQQRSQQPQGLEHQECQYCGREGHVLVMCRTYQRDHGPLDQETINHQNVQRRQTFQRMRPKPPMTCHLCGKLGHIMLNCDYLQRARQEIRQQQQQPMTQLTSRLGQMQLQAAQTNAIEVSPQQEMGLPQRSTSAPAVYQQTTYPQQPQQVQMQPQGQQQSNRLTTPSPVHMVGALWETGGINQEEALNLRNRIDYLKRIVLPRVDQDEPPSDHLGAIMHTDRVHRPDYSQVTEKSSINEFIRSLTEDVDRCLNMASRVQPKTTMPANTRYATTDTGDPVVRRSRAEHLASLLGSSSAADHH